MDPEHPKQRRSDGSVVAVAVAAIVLMLCGVGVAAYYFGKSNGSTSQAASSSGGSSGGASSTGQTTAVPQEVALGAHAFVQFACAQCHGDQGKGGVSPYVPALDSLAPNLTAQQLTSTIEHGAGVSQDPTRPFMPIWHGIIAKPQIKELVAYMKAGFPDVAAADAVAVPAGQGDATAGQALYQKYGCINCHGPNGLGGVPNPQSPDTTVPPLTGKDFTSEFNTDAKIADMIQSGSVIGKAPIVSMPHWGSILTDQQIAQLVAYIKTLS
jgi:cbb3-type cytochrome c oxidase subunit III